MRAAAIWWASCLAIFAAGLPGFSAFFMLMRLYQATQNTRTMFWIYLMENGLTVVAALALNPILGVPGLVVAWVGPTPSGRRWPPTTCAAGWARSAARYTVRALARILIASGITGAAAFGVGRLFPSGAGDPVLIARLVAQVGVGAARLSGGGVGHRHQRGGSGGRAGPPGTLEIQKVTSARSRQPAWASTTATCCEPESNTNVPAGVPW